MQILYLGKTNRVSLDTEKSVDTVTVSLITSLGSYVKDNGNNDIKDVSCSLDPETGKYYADLTLHSTVTKTDVYLHWTATLSSIAITLEDANSPEDGIIKPQEDTSPLLISPTYLMDNYLRGIDISDIEETFQGEGYRSILRSQIRAATGWLESETMVYFTSKTITGERHTYYLSEIAEKFWTVTLMHKPIISIDKVQLKLNDYEIVKDLPSEWILVENNLDGMVSIVPYAGGVAAFVFSILTQGGLGAALLFSEAASIPAFFSYDYKTGLDWANLDDVERENIKSAIGRETAIRMLPNLDVHRGISSESRSADGISTSKSYTSSAMFGEHSAAIEAYYKQQAKWMNLFKRKYLTRLPMDGFTP